MKYHSSVVMSLFHLTGHKTAAIQISIFLVYMPFPFIQLQVFVQKRIFQIYFASYLCNFFSILSVWGEKRQSETTTTKYTQRGVEKDYIITPKSRIYIFGSQTIV